MRVDKIVLTKSSRETLYNDLQTAIRLSRWQQDCLVEFPLNGMLVQVDGTTEFSLRTVEMILESIGTCEQVRI